MISTFNVPASSWAATKFCAPPSRVTVWVKPAEDPPDPKPPANIPPPVRGLYPLLIVPPVSWIPVAGPVCVQPIRADSAPGLTNKLGGTAVVVAIEFNNKITKRIVMIGI